MKVLPELYPTDLEAPAANSFALPGGLIGFESYRQAELLYQPDHLPFLWLKLTGPGDAIHFVVIEPGGIVPGYEPELFDVHAGTLDLNDASEALVLNIVTLQRQLVHEGFPDAPRTREGRQFVISNYSRYSAHHPLVEKTPAAGRVATH